MDNEKNMAPATETAENTQTNEGANAASQDKTPKTYTRDELNKIIGAERSKLRDEILKEEEAKRTEAEKLAKMDADEKAKYELDKINKEKNDALSKLNAYELKETATKIAKEKGMDTSLLDVLDFSKETADSVKERIDSINTIFNKAVENKVNEKLKEKSPKYVSSNNTGSSVEEYLKKKYSTNPYFKK